MGQKIICRRPAHSSETIAGEAVFPRPSAGDCGHAWPASGHADAKRPGETASRPLRIVPPGADTSICWRSFAVLNSLFSPAELPAVVSLYLFDIAQHLLQIARSRACRNFAAMANEARAIGRIAGNLGAVHIRRAAHQLEEACRTSNHAATYSLLSILSQTCDEAETELNCWLASNPVTRGT
jgi:HPt (histidine-containing phosphotransfer) domain-containing protein